MVTYALLGATGATGSSVLRCLLSDPPPDLHLHILVRSKGKLLRAFPRLADISTVNPKITIFEGDATSAKALTSCLTNASLIFMCIGQNGSPPGTTLYSDSVSALIAALSQLKDQASPHLANNSSSTTTGYQPPTVLQLRSASLNPPLAAQPPALVHKAVMFCLHHSYADLRRACALYPPACAAGLLEYIFVDPPTIHDAQGTHGTGYRLITGGEPQATALSYADLGAAMCEIAERAGDFEGKAVGVTATGKVREEWGVLMGYLLKGAMGRVKEGVVRGVPFLYGPMAPFFVIGMYGGYEPRPLAVV